MRDTILARAAGYVQEKEELSTTKTDDGIFHVKLRCVVSRQGIEDTWGVVKNLLTQMGRPKVLVMITEKADEVTGTVQAGRAVGQESLKQIVQDESTVQARIEKLLLTNGFDLVEKSQVEEIDKKDLQAALAEDNPAKVQAIAKKFKAQIFIKGTVHAACGLPKDIGGVLFYTYEGQGNIKCYVTDTAKLLASESTPAPRCAACSASGAPPPTRRSSNSATAWPQPSRTTSCANGWT